jgi:hypothetical protein
MRAKSWQDSLKKFLNKFHIKVFAKHLKAVEIFFELLYNM